MGVIDTQKMLTKRIPFYSVERDSWGWVRQCARPTKRSCRKCIFGEKCMVEGEVR